VQVQENRRDNLILASLPNGERKRLEPFLQDVELEVGKVLIEPEEPIRNIYFPIDLVTSTIQDLRDGSSVETGLMGFEGVIGIQFWLHQETTTTRTLVQVGGTALRMSSQDFRREVMEKPSPINPLIASYVHAFLSMTSQTAACNRMHELNTRLARWLCLVYDRVERDEFSMRQDFLAMMLGVHRPAVTIAASTLQNAGLISYRRGSMIIKDATGLRNSACECYAIIEAQFEKMFGADWRERAQTSRLPA
jgi:CRP-like cAMP-binding protein